MTRQQLKSEIKTLAEQIKTSSRAFKDAQRAGTVTWQLRGELGKAQYEFRHKHIVASLLRGRTRDQIERPLKGNGPSEEYILRLLELYKEVPCEEALCPVPV